MASAMISIYVHDDADLNFYLRRLEELGFADFDWCEMKRTGTSDRALYAPCETINDEGSDNAIPE